MKTFTIITLMLLLVFSCKNDNKTNLKANTDNSKYDLEGAWELTGYYNYVDNKVTDSFNKSEGYRQVKMYTPHRVMWSKSVPSDSSEWFGYGTYDIEGDELIEVLDYGSIMMSKIIQEKREFKYELMIKNDTFSQIEMDEDGNRLYAENYKRID